ncbi:MAG: transcription antitermination factor NusB [Pseudomonadota bacterium]
MSKIDSTQKRTNARLAAVQALYQLEQSGTGVETVILEFQAHRLGGALEEHILHEADDDLFADLVRGVVRMQAKLDPFISRQLAKGWSLGRLDATVRAILRAGLYELVHRADIPVKVTINEYVELAKAFFEDEEIGFVNGVLDAAANDVRADDLQASP